MYLVILDDQINLFMITDPVYEGKSMQGMIDLVQRGHFPTGSKVLYAHLGGGPALNVKNPE
jgi:1-aminocyclopropane-1-carboxylate deaminase